MFFQMKLDKFMLGKTLLREGGSPLTLISFRLILMWQINPVIVASFAFMDK